jgi:hypothetical protein
MSLFIPDSYYYGEKEFPWGGLIEPKLYQRVSWLLVVSGVIGKIPVISMYPSNTVPVSVCLDGTVDSSVCLPGIDVYVGPFGISNFNIFKSDTTPFISRFGINSCIQSLSTGVEISKSLLNFDLSNATISVGTTISSRVVSVGISNRVSMK